MKKILIALFAILMVSTLVTSCDLFKQKGLQGVMLRTGPATPVVLGAGGSIMGVSRTLTVGTQYSKITTGQFSMVCYDSSERDTIRGGISLTDPNSGGTSPVTIDSNNPGNYDLTVDTSKMSMTDYRYPTADIEGTYDTILAAVAGLTITTSSGEKPLNINDSTASADPRIDYILFTSKEVVDKAYVDLVINKLRNSAPQAFIRPADEAVRIALVPLKNALDVRNNPGKTAVLSITLLPFNFEEDTPDYLLECEADKTVVVNTGFQKILSAAVSWE